MLNSHRGKVYKSYRKTFPQLQHLPLAFALYPLSYQVISPHLVVIKSLARTCYPYYHLTPSLLVLSQVVVHILLQLEPLLVWQVIPFD
jgi:hypothetical protein